MRIIWEIDYEPEDTEGMTAADLAMAGAKYAQEVMHDPTSIADVFRVEIGSGAVATVDLEKGGVTNLDTEFDGSYKPDEDGRYAGLVCQTKYTENPYYGCEDGDGYTDDERVTETRLPVCMVSVYAIHRVCGGPAEGGDWYNRYDCLLSIPLSKVGDREEILETIRFLRSKFPNEGDIYSVRSGTEYAFIPEVTAGSQNSGPYRYE